MVERDPQVGDAVLVHGVIQNIEDGTAIVALFRSWPTGIAVPIQCGALEHNERAAHAEAAMPDDRRRLTAEQLEPDRRSRFRTGRKNPRNIYLVDQHSGGYDSDQHIGCMFSPDDGVVAADALNAMYHKENR